MSRYYRTTRARQTGGPVTTGHGDDLGLDTVGEGPWYNICDRHGEICSHTSLALARSFAADPQMWCSECQISDDHVATSTPNLYPDLQQQLPERE